MSATLGLLAGGRASRLGGIDKAWMQRDGVPQVLRMARRFGPKVAEVLVSANRDLARYVQAGLQAVPDRHAGIGPIGGLDALAQACRTRWLLTLPVDLVDANDCLFDSLAAAGGKGAYVEDAGGVQPLVALWQVDALRPALHQSIAAGEYSVQRLQASLGMSRVPLEGVRMGNLNTFEDIDAAGVQVE